MAKQFPYDSVGLKGAKTIGDEKVSSLLNFTWPRTRESIVSDANSHITVRANESHSDDQPAVSRRQARQSPKD